MGPGHTSRAVKEALIVGKSSQETPVAPKVCLGFCVQRARERDVLGKLRISCPSGVAECNVNPRADTVIFLFLVTYKCTECSVRGEGEREWNTDWTEGDSE